MTVAGLGMLGLQAIQHYKLGCMNKQNWTELKTQHFDSKEDNEDNQPWDQVGNVAVIFAQGSEISGFVSQHANWQTNHKNQPLPLK